MSVGYPLRSCILLLFPFHTCMIFNTFGEPFYVFSEPVKACSEFIVSVYLWWMTALFTIAGISSAYALKKRNRKEYAKERVFKLLFVNGVEEGATKFIKYCFEYLSHD